MNPHVPAWQTAIYHLLRLTPLAAAPLVLNLKGLSPQVAIKAAEQIVAIVTILVLWNLSESALMLWYQASREKSEKSRGYGIVAGMLGLLTLFVLPLYRAKCTEVTFVILLTALALRGIARSTWQQEKVHTAIPAIAVSHALVALLSFLSFLDTLLWQTTVVAISIAAALTSCEVAWYRTAFDESAKTRWLPPTLRVIFFAGPVCLATLAFMGHLAQPYAAVLLCLFWSQRAASKMTESRSVRVVTFLPAAGFYALFLGIIGVCTWYLT